MMCFVLADAALEKFGGDSMADVEGAWRRWMESIADLESHIPKGALS
jgi:hypothetical protein